MLILEASITCFIVIASTSATTENKSTEIPLGYSSALIAPERLESNKTRIAKSRAKVFSGGNRQPRGKIIIVPKGHHNHHGGKMQLTLPKIYLTAGVATSSRIKGGGGDGGGGGGGWGNEGNSGWNAFNTGGGGSSGWGGSNAGGGGGNSGWGGSNAGGGGGNSGWGGSGSGGGGGWESSLGGGGGQFGWGGTSGGGQMAANGWGNSGGGGGGGQFGWGGVNGGGGQWGGPTGGAGWGDSGENGGGGWSHECPNKKAQKAKKKKAKAQKKLAKGQKKGGGWGSGSSSGSGWGNGGGGEWRSQVNSKRVGFTPAAVNRWNSETRQNQVYSTDLEDDPEIVDEDWTNLGLSTGREGRTDTPVRRKILIESNHGSPLTKNSRNSVNRFRQTVSPKERIKETVAATSPRIFQVHFDSLEEAEPEHNVQRQNNEHLRRTTFPERIQFQLTCPLHNSENVDAEDKCFYLQI